MSFIKQGTIASPNAYLIFCLDYDTIRNKDEHQKDSFMDMIYNELIFTDSKLRRIIRKYKKAKSIAKRNYKKYKECETRLNEALEYMDLNGNFS
jgi:hypothetical protein